MNDPTRKKLDVRMKGESAWYKVLIFVHMPDFENMVNVPAERNYCCSLGDDMAARVFRTFFHVAFYPDGYGISNKGYISALFRVKNVLFENKFNFLAYMSVVDGDNVERCSQTFKAECRGFHEAVKKNARFGIEKFLKRSFVVDANLLHGGELRILCNVAFKMDVDYSEMLFPCREMAASSKHWIMDDSWNAGQIKFRLGGENDPLLWRALCQKSPYFEGLSRAPMLEREREYILVDRKEFRTYCDMLRYVQTGNLDHISSVFECMELSVLADKYLMADLKKSCFEYMIGFDNRNTDWSKLVKDKTYKNEFMKSQNYYLCFWDCEIASSLFSEKEKPNLDFYL